MTKRCFWVNLENPCYVKYHDEEWGVPKYDDKELFELLILELFQAGLSWECILNKRNAFKEAFNNFDYQIIAEYDDDKLNELMNNSKIIRNKLKIKATINNAKIFMKIQEKWGSFSNYIWHFTNNQIVDNKAKELITSSPLSDEITRDLKKEGMKFIGTTIIYSYLQAIGIVNDHDLDCFFKNKKI